MNPSNKFQQILEFFLEKDFAYIPSIWFGFDEQSRIEFKTQIVPSLGNEKIIEIYESLCFINENLAKEMLGFFYEKAKNEKSYTKTSFEIKKENEIILNKIEKGKNKHSFEEYINTKVEYLQCFKDNLEQKGFDREMVYILVAQELDYINSLTSGE